MGSNLPTITDEILTWAFGTEGLTDEQFEAWLTASAERRCGLIARLRGVRAWLEGGRLSAGRKKEIATSAGLTPGYLRNLVDAWRKAKPEERSFHLVGLPAERRAYLPDRDRMDLRAKVETAIDEQDGNAGPHSPTPVQEIVRRVGIELRSYIRPPSDETLRKVVRERRRERSRGRDFGALVAFDDVTLAIRSASAAVFRAVLCIDVATGLVLGYLATTAAPPGPEHIYETARGAAGWLRATPLPGIAVAAEGPRVVVGLAGEDPLGALQLAKRVPEWIDEDRATRGVVSSDVFGGRLGRLRLRPGRDGPTAFPLDDLEIVTVDEAERLLRISVERHNGALLRSGDEPPAVRERRLALADLLIRSVDEPS